MEWKDIATSIGKFAPLLGTVVGGPAGAAVGALISATLGTDNDPSAVQQALVSNPDVALKLAQLESDQRVQLQTLAVTAEQNRLQAETSQLGAVNTTMQSEAVSEHWPTYSWRPFIGFIFGIMALGVYFVLPLLGITIPTIPTEAWMAFGAILGVASWHRGKMQADPLIPTINKG
jgi:uncharacterized membrane protein